MEINFIYNYPDGGAYARTEHEWINYDYDELSSEVKELIRTYLSNLPVVTNSEQHITISLNIAVKNIPLE